MASKRNSIEQRETVPNVVFGPGVNPAVYVEPNEMATTMVDLGVSDHAIGNTTLYIGGRNNYFTRGFQIPNFLDRMLHGAQERNEGSGVVIRVNTIYRGKERSTPEMNKSLVHELEHIAQNDRNDARYYGGLVAVYGLALVGGFAGARLTKGGFAKKALGSTFGAVLGHQAGYVLAPHEHQAKKRSEEVVTTTIRRDT